MEQYYAGGHAIRVSDQETALEYGRYIELQPGVSIEGMKQLSAEELDVLSAHFHRTP